MDNNIDKILKHIENEFGDLISTESFHYMEVDLKDVGEKLGFKEIKDKYPVADVYIPIKNPVSGMKVMIDGRTFVNYSQFESGIAVPAYVAKNSGRKFKEFIPKESLVLNFH